ncbi:diacylglycerol kinase [Stutzerimonas decontaminans]|jgi:diacylglycerol kinase (ATP)|uniref:Diacylglycerol kinase n=2 Tax=Stutzerimonas TaxID=2901164 RepID=A0ABX4W127_9GAMM|nr:diacylglycerol kinase [Stutzerimonas decontaminans]AHY41676.1 diacylglycerol kinase [Stutzerimonas decontaminans]MCQ4245333.1 diacylglycerol kinase [Stutzerimonas decontaminans]MCW8154952.1 diacylglycerol kinase [Stutzerimonas stutzeri]PNF85917.1 diacylglycerol kinase [Stutzerimonas decontaminans]
MSSEPSAVVADGAALKGRSGLVRIWYACGYSLAGLRAAYAGEAAFRQLVWLSLLLIPLALLLDVSRVERAVLIAVVFLALIVELLNSAIEATVDRISFELHPLSKQAKDMGSAAQLLALCLIGLVWAVILIP